MLFRCACCEGTLGQYASHALASSLVSVHANSRSLPLPLFRAHYFDWREIQGVSEALNDAWRDLVCGDSWQTMGGQGKRTGLLGDSTWPGSHLSADTVCSHSSARPFLHVHEHARLHSARHAGVPPAPRVSAVQARSRHHCPQFCHPVFPGTYASNPIWSFCDLGTHSVRPPHRHESRTSIFSLAASHAPLICTGLKRRPAHVRPEPQHRARLSGRSHLKKTKHTITTRRLQNGGGRLHGRATTGAVLLRCRTGPTARHYWAVPVHHDAPAGRRSRPARSWRQPGHRPQAQTHTQ